MSALAKGIERERRTRVLDTIHIQEGDPLYPAALHFLGDNSPKTLAALGNADLLKVKALGLFCSVKCSGNIILKTYDLACALRDAEVPVIGGFHSPMEKECLSLLLRGAQPVIIYAARSIERMRLPSEWHKPVDNGRLLLVSAFGSARRRVTTDLAQQRNRVVAAMADRIFVAHAAPGSKTERFCKEIFTWGKPLLTLESEENSHLIRLGARPIHKDECGSLFL